ncbi:MAG TPA: hypothetical protein VEZ46_16950 [Mycobacteriales bacterium]|jgi:hypothetical protein|nr:hypothetical protein [Mycobacteriales bacterium]
MLFVGMYAVLAVVFAVIGLLVEDFRWMLVLAAAAAIGAIVVALKARRTPTS